MLESRPTGRSRRKQSFAMACTSGCSQSSADVWPTAANAPLWPEARHQRPLRGHAPRVSQRCRSVTILARTDAARRLATTASNADSQGDCSPALPGAAAESGSRQAIAGQLPAVLLRAVDLHVGLQDLSVCGIVSAWSQSARALRLWGLSAQRGVPSIRPPGDLQYLEERLDPKCMAMLVAGAHRTSVAVERRLCEKHGPTARSRWPQEAHIPCSHALTRAVLRWSSLPRARRHRPPRACPIRSASVA